MQNKTFKILQLSDMHLFGDKSREQWGFNTYNLLQKVVDNIKERKLQPDILLLTGDLSQDKTAESYQHCLDIFPKFDIKIYAIPGNHDSVKTMGKYFVGDLISKDKIIELKDWLIILLDSTCWFNALKFADGYLRKQQLAFLDNSLAVTNKKNVLVVLHHHPVPMHSRLIDKYILRNPKRFIKILNRYDKNFVVIFGHVHQQFEETINGILYLGCPATCMQFMPGARKLIFDKQTAGFRWLELGNGGKITTEVFRI